MENNKEIKDIDYKFWKDSKMIGMILLIVAVSLQIFAFMKVPVLTTFNSYTIGMMLGACNPLFYIFVIYISLMMIFKDSIKIPSWMKLTRISYWFVVIATAYIVASTGHYQSTSGWTTIGSNSFGAMNQWFHEFTSSAAWYPSTSYGGVIGVFLYSFFSMCVSGIGAFAISITLMVVSLSFLISGTSIGLYRDIIKKKSLALAKKEIPEENQLEFAKIKPVEVELSKPVSRIESLSKPLPKPEPTINIKESSKSSQMTFDIPFEDPFDDPFEDEADEMKGR